MTRLAIVAAVLLALPGMASAAAFTNGSFEAGVDPGSNFITLGNGSTAITGWTVGGNSIDYIGGLWMASNGSRSIDLSGGDAGTLSQNFDTVTGQRYRVTFDLAGNPDAGPVSRALSVMTEADSANYMFDTTGATRANMNWTGKTFLFTAAGISTTLRFASGTAGAYGPALDNVSVSAVPEPATWAMMVGGFGLIGGAMRRHRRTMAFA